MDIYELGVFTSLPVKLCTFSTCAGESPAKSAISQSENVPTETGNLFMVNGPFRLTQWERGRYNVDGTILYVLAFLCLNFLYVKVQFTFIMYISATFISHEGQVTV